MMNLKNKDMAEEAAGTRLLLDLSQRHPLADKIHSFSA